MRYMNAAQLHEALPMATLASAMQDAFAALSSGEATVPVRTALPVPAHNGTVLWMGAALPGSGVAAKVASVFHDNAARNMPTVNGVALLLDERTGVPQLVCDAGALTALRTGAASAAATDLLARRDARIAVVVGNGAQASTQVRGIDAVRALQEIRICGRDPDKVRRFIEATQPRVEAHLLPGDSVAAAVRDADIVCLATNSTTPVLQGAWLRPGMHINGVGSFTHDMSELDVDGVSRSRVFVDSQSGALAEAGDLVQAEAAGGTARQDWTELGAVVSGDAPGRQSDDDITFFKSVGHAVQDAAAAALALQSGLGQELT